MAHSYALTRSLVGEADGSLTAFQVASDTGTSAPAVTEAAEAITLLDVTVSGDASPAFGDVTGDGLVDLVLGASDGSVVMFPNTGNSTLAKYAKPDVTTILPPSPETHSVPTLGDLNGDGVLDLVKSPPLLTRGQCPPPASPLP